MSVMPRTCLTCCHPERARIDTALVAGEPLRNIAKRFAISPASLNRHRAHLPAHVAKAHEAERVASADSLLSQVQSLQAKALDLLAKAERAGDYRTALAGVREARACLELLAEVEGKLDRRDVVNILIAPEWIALRTSILIALEPFPEARLAIAAALQGTGEGDPS